MMLSIGEIEGYQLRIESTHKIHSDTLSFFHAADFCNRIIDREVLYFNLYNSTQPCLSIAFEVNNDEAISLPKSPYGGFIYKELPSEYIVNWYVKEMIRFFENENKGIKILLSPKILSSLVDLENVLLSNSFKVKYIDTNQHIAVNKHAVENNFNRNRKRKLVACQQQGLQFRIIPVTYLEDAYTLIKQSRQKKHYPVTMAFSQLKDAFTKFPSQYLLFGVFHEDLLLATAVSVKVNQQILYNFYHGDLLSHRSYSPITMLVQGIYQYCQQSGYSILDLGISTDKGILNQGLYDFKRSFGTVDSSKSYLEHIKDE